MTDAQTFLDQNYPKYGVCVREKEGDVSNKGKTRSEITDLDFFNQNLTGSWDLSGFVNLRALKVSYNNFTNLDFLNTIPNPEKLIRLVVSNNNLQPTTLEIFRRFVKLEWLYIGTDDGGINWNHYNRFTGSLEPLKNMSKLQVLCIDATDIDSGLEYLPGNLSDNISCFANTRPNPKVVKIQEQLSPFNYNIKSWQLANSPIVNAVNRIKELETQIQKVTAELEQEKNNHQHTKDTHQLQLADLATIIFPSSSVNNNLGFADLKNQAQKNKTKLQDLKTALSEEQKANQLLTETIQQLQQELAQTKAELKEQSELTMAKQLVITETGWKKN